MEKPIATCVLGTGLSGLTFHVPFVLALKDLFSLHSVLERNPTQEGGNVKRRFGTTVKIHRSFDAIIADSEIELIIVGTPSDTHYDFAKAALLAGKHVLVEKPVTPNTNQARELYDIAKSRKLVLYAYQNRRWDADFLALKKLLSLPETSPQSIGSVLEFESQLAIQTLNTQACIDVIHSYDRYRTQLKGNWKDEARPATGLTYDLGSHLIDQCLSLLGRPDKITGFVQNIRGIGSPDVNDWFTIHLHYSKSPSRPYPVTAILRASILSARSSQLRYVVRGSRGTYIKYGVDVQEDQLKAMPTPETIFEAGFGKEPESLWGTVENVHNDGVTFSKAIWPSDAAGCYVELFKNLAAAIREGAELSVPWKDAQTVIELIELAHQSSEEGRTLTVPPVM
ncbi:hypothetical protein AGABI2DRAFT_150170 [Agaricus bisporus var. bisporus H97]|uniref:hypothetical protein n=1 Tax=Agaricus bisporus var. bisporus (strain H97 / ATCC MYA-4626 / FGSC 10389) TaxID=936046 RepID=UPI00029F628B|nr:hypothetical protein AGABI2DRAFT_150170 [Agaricus bisporus var. bisporus H97]EKV48341.1 hypothetical protein AGABI2DRAFT_150170 [Agaricus bisporus var. bisporus H97]